jgi:hypothetical protein
VPAVVQQERGLISEAKVSIGVTTGILGSVFVFIVILGACYWRRKQYEKAILNAIEEVERGTSKGGENEERMVLESRVSIVFHEEPEEGEEDEEEERGRQGMSLARRDYN